MARAIVAVVAAFSLWTVLWLGLGAAAPAVVPDLVDPTQPLTHTGVLLVYLAWAAIISVAAGRLCAVIRRDDPMPAVWALAGLLLLVGIGVEAAYWSMMPVWYHLVFLALLVPATVLGGRLRARGALPLTALATLALVACAPDPDPAGDVVAGAVAGAVAGVFDGSGGRWVDLTHAFDAETIYWPTDTAGFRLDTLAYGTTDGGWFYASNAFATAEHGGTHLDAPIHFAEGRWTADEIPLSGLVGPAAVVDVSDRATPDYAVSVADLEGWEAIHGTFPDGAILLLRTGWGTRWNDRAAYLGTERTGPEAVPALHFPGLAPEAARWLVDQRGIVAVGIDTPSIDPGQSTDFQSHVTLYGENIVGFENVAALEQLPPAGAYVVALPMKIRGGSGGPLRIVAFVPSGM